jgi:hypothetical protein
MSYVLKDHLGSLYATVTNGDVEYYSFDAWGRDRNHNTLQYDNISTTFDRGHLGKVLISTFLDIKQ